MKKILALVAVAALVAFAAPALAANPFMDVPMNHWAYDAISQLAASGVINGYPDATYKGNQPMTRYEMATIVARALAVVDMTKASKQDVEMLKRLVVEFKDELDALGVKVENIDERLAVMEERLGGWQMYGQFRMDAKVGHDDSVYYWDDNDGDGVLEKWGVNPYGFGGERETTISRYRIYLRKYINETTTFGARLGGSDNTFERYWVSTKLPWDIDFTVGRFNMDWEDSLGFYTDNDAWFMDYTTPAGFLFEKGWGMADVKFFLGHEESGQAINTDSGTGRTTYANADATVAALRADFNFNEKFRFGIMAAMQDYDDDAVGGNDLTVYDANFTVNFTPAIAFKGVYYMQNVDLPAGTTNYLGQARDDSPSGYRAILDVSQEAFGFTSLWLEYGHMDQDFVGSASIMSANVAYDNYGAYVLANRYSDMDSVNVLFFKAKQQWNDKWNTFLRYVNAGYDRTYKSDTSNWTVGFGYQYNPAVYFELLYDNIDYGNNDALGTGFLNDSDSLIRFRTHVYF